MIINTILLFIVILWLIVSCIGLWCIYLSLSGKGSQYYWDSSIRAYRRLTNDCFIDRQFIIDNFIKRV